MSKRYVVKRKIKKKNMLVLLGISAFILVSSFQMIKNTFFQEDDVLAVNPVEVNKNTEQVNVENNSDTENKNDTKNKKNKFKVVVDAVYGGSDGGSRGYNGILQKNINLEIALKVRDALDRYEDVEVVLTRDDDSTVSTEKRIEIINNSNADFIVSIMQNTERTGDVSGVETYVLPKDDEKSNTTLGYSLQQAMTMYIDTKDRGVLAKNMDILKKSNIPGAVVNTGFISNKTEGTNLNSKDYQLRMAEGISQGILYYIDKHLKE